MIMIQANITMPRYRDFFSCSFVIYGLTFLKRISEMIDKLYRLRMSLERCSLL